MIITLKKAFHCCFGAPQITKIDTTIFTVSYFGTCMECDFCRDECCNHGVDVDRENVARLLERQSELAAFVGVPASAWFKPGFTEDREFPGGAYTRTNTQNGACLFLDKKHRGCLIHRFCMEKNIDFHLLKPMVSCLFPVTFDDGLLHPMDEMAENFVCMTANMNLYRGVRSDLQYYFGPEFIATLDAMEAQTLQSSQKDASPPGGGLDEK